MLFWLQEIATGLRSVQIPQYCLISRVAPWMVPLSTTGPKPRKAHIVVRVTYNLPPFSSTQPRQDPSFPPAQLPFSLGTKVSPLPFPFLFLFFVYSLSAPLLHFHRTEQGVILHIFYPPFRTTLPLQDNSIL